MHAIAVIKPRKSSIQLLPLSQRHFHSFIPIFTSCKSMAQISLKSTSSHICQYAMRISAQTMVVSSKFGIFSCSEIPSIISLFASKPIMSLLIFRQEIACRDHQYRDHYWYHLNHRTQHLEI